MLLPKQSPPVIRARGCVVNSLGGSAIRPQQANPDFEIRTWKCAKVRVGGTDEGVLTYHLQGTGGGWHALPEYACS